MMTCLPVRWWTNLQLKTGEGKAVKGAQHHFYHRNHVPQVAQMNLHPLYHMNK